MTDNLLTGTLKNHIKQTEYMYGCTGWSVSFVVYMQQKQVSGQGIYTFINQIHVNAIGA